MINKTKNSLDSKQQQLFDRHRLTTIVNKLLRGCCVDAFISDARCLKKEENKNNKFVLSGGFFQKQQQIQRSFQNNEERKK